MNVIDNVTEQNSDSMLRHISQFFDGVTKVEGDFTTGLFIAPATTEKKYITLLTAGISNHSVQSADEANDNLHLELFMYLPPDWPIDGSELHKPKNFWPVQSLLDLAEHIQDEETSISSKFSIVSNGESDQSLGPNTDFSALLMSYENSDFGQFQSTSGDTVNIMLVFPIYTEEKELEKKSGIVPLLKLFQKNNIGMIVRPNRLNVAKQTV